MNIFTAVVQPKSVGVVFDGLVRNATLIGNASSSSFIVSKISNIFDWIQRNTSFSGKTLEYDCVFSPSTVTPSSKNHVIGRGYVKIWISVAAGHERVWDQTHLWVTSGGG